MEQSRARVIDAKPASPAGPDGSDQDVEAMVEPWLGRVIAADGLFVTNERQRIVSWSPTAERMLGYTADEVVDHPCFLVLVGREPGGHPVCRSSCQVTRNARHGRGTAAYEVTARARDGSLKYVSNSVLVVGGQKGRFHVIHMLRELRSGPPLEPRREAAVSPELEPGAGVETLTRRELEVLRLFAGGTTLDEVARQLSISAFTARNHLSNAERKLGAGSRLELVLTAMRRGLV